ncbi:hypothetical protein BU26DRAFT_134791 [Trematosphaeria pertusa]|uniref:Uncharacterized protein n=1 Tax=Trematosphaeria pertusa TaxID=390896 RepID=A0A6A6IYC4_9PLEO|nr:uncharacterized protein BU26DRAFT_134791 [Trematosphaeria pertusa]KAF2254183.1 hypothetical protein BU26DRAFT_134791 [Trematosphaeria pertusa]
MLQLRSRKGGGLCCTLRRHCVLFLGRTDEHALRRRSSRQGSSLLHRLDSVRKYAYITPEFLEAGALVGIATLFPPVRSCTMETRNAGSDLHHLLFFRFTSPQPNAMRLWRPCRAAPLTRPCHCMKAFALSLWMLAEPNRTRIGEKSVREARLASFLRASGDSWRVGRQTISIALGWPVSSTSRSRYAAHLAGGHWFRRIEFASTCAAPSFRWISPKCRLHGCRHPCHGLMKRS